MYGCLSLTASPVTCSMCPVKVSFSPPDAKSHTLIVLSADPVTNHELAGSKQIERTQPICPETTRYSFQGACHSGRGHLEACLRMTLALNSCFVAAGCATASALLPLAWLEDTLEGDGVASERAFPGKGARGSWAKVGSWCSALDDASAASLAHDPSYSSLNFAFLLTSNSVSSSWAPYSKPVVFFCDEDDKQGLRCFFLDLGKRILVLLILSSTALCTDTSNLLVSSAATIALTTLASLPLPKAEDLPVRNVGQYFRLGLSWAASEHCCVWGGGNQEPAEEDPTRGRSVQCVVQTTRTTTRTTRRRGGVERGRLWSYRRSPRTPWGRPPDSFSPPFAEASAVGGCCSGLSLSIQPSPPAECIWIFAIWIFPRWMPGGLPRKS